MPVLLVASALPKDGVASRNQERVLVNFHGGGFIIGAGPGK